MLLYILPPELAPANGPVALHETPYGRVTQRGSVLIRDVDARALIYAAKAAGAERILAADRVSGISPLLEEGDLVIPADTIDQTRLKPFTFFVGKGYGFIKLDPPFCPQCMAALLDSGRSRQARTFARATYVGLDGPRELTPAERRMYRTWSADVAGTGLLPEAYLARELELCYAAVTVVESGELLPVLEAAAQALAQGHERTCACGQTMAFARANGLVGEDWRTW